MAAPIGQSPLPKHIHSVGMPRRWTRHHSFRRYRPDCVHRHHDAHNPTIPCRRPCVSMVHLLGEIHQVNEPTAICKTSALPIRSVRPVGQTASRLPHTAPSHSDTVASCAGQTMPTAPRRTDPRCFPNGLHIDLRNDFTLHPAMWCNVKLIHRYRNARVPPANTAPSHLQTVR
jgi:hypothetical protein